MLEISLIAVLLLVLFIPITIHLIERNIEPFLLVMGLLSVTFAHLWGSEPVWTGHLVREAFVEPIMITLVVIAVGIVVYFSRDSITGFIVKVEHRLGSKLFCFTLITVLGLLSSFITAIMAAILLVEIVSALKFDQKFETRLVILGCFSIGLGAALTPLGEPLSTICVAKLQGAPYNADFFFLLRHLGKFIVPGIFAIGLLGAVMEPVVKEGLAKDGLKEKETDNIKDVFVCGAKIYIFIMALIFLGAGFKPIIHKYIIKLPGALLYWINMVSAVMDNATITAAEISPEMSLFQIKAVLMGLLIAGGMMIPGNIPNIISAGRLGIKSREWAKLGIPLGLALMVIYFLIFELIR
jgi:predicted cation transporter